MFVGLLYLFDVPTFLSSLTNFIQTYASLYPKQVGRKSRWWRGGLQGLRKLQIVFKRGFSGKIFCEKNLPKSAPPPPQKMPFSSDLCHFKTTLAQFQKKSGKILIFVLFFPMCPPQIFCEIPIWPSFSASGAWALERFLKPCSLSPC